MVRCLKYKENSYPLIRVVPSRNEKNNLLLKLTEEQMRFLQNNEDELKETISIPSLYTLIIGLSQEITEYKTKQTQL